jgi:N4-gp56 family major capsid protein
MAYFIVGTGEDVTPLQHSHNIFKEYLMQLALKPFIGRKGSGRPIIVDDELKGSAGDTVRFHFIPQNYSDGIIGQDASVLGNEQTLEEKTMDLSIDEVNQAFRKKGRMTDKRIIWKFRKEAKSQLSNWFAQKSEDWLFEALTGVRNGMTYLWSNTTDLVSGTGRCIRADGAAGAETVTAAGSDNTALAAAMNSADKFNVDVIELAVIQAKQGNSSYRMRPVRVGKNGEEFFILFVDLRAARDLKSDPRWENKAYSVIERGIGDDPLATGALGTWDNVIVKTNERIKRFTVDGGTNTYARNLLVGADAAVLAWASTIDYTEELIDHGRQLSCAANEIRGQKKLTFDGVDMGVMQVITASN